MKELIKILQSKIGDQTVNTFNARELYKFLDIRTDFTDWIKRQIKYAGLIEGIDFATVLIFLKNEVKSKTSKGRPTTEYHLTLKAGKNIGMIARNDKGIEVRAYFIERELECEQLKTNAASSSEVELLSPEWQAIVKAATDTARLKREVEQQSIAISNATKQLELQATTQASHEQTLTKQQATVKQLEEKVALQTGSPEYYTIVAFARLKTLTLTPEAIRNFGGEATRLSRLRKISIQKLPDARWGTVGAYHTSVLLEVFKPHLAPAVQVPPTLFIVPANLPQPYTVELNTLSREQLVLLGTMVLAHLRGLGVVLQLNPGDPENGRVSGKPYTDSIMGWIRYYKPAIVTALQEENNPTPRGSTMN